MNRNDLHWSPVCQLDDILPDSGVCALVKERSVAIFRVEGEAPALYAIDNFDPNAGANVLSRGLVGNLGARTVVASPIFKQHFDLASGECLEAPHNSVTAYPVRLEGSTVQVAV
ncbi:nitrite reductase small subunit NirD [uncultured Ramlibacter sp.]|uniref:nitrite reductase small subunit NirD n=1 Tax=uncultured Ramlibacter sp. TaxID=260755 RepID=UPI00260EF751|nr:nitrite reductase small subunit NirD [uncultured Ramlibacter sp.]